MAVLSIMKLPEMTFKNTNEKIIVLREQGFGDDVMFSRYLKPLKDLGYEVLYLPSRAS